MTRQNSPARPADSKERLSKVLASCGVASRRKSEELILAGRVSVNGQTVKILGTKVDPLADRICVNGKKIRQESKVVYILNKPRGYICTNLEERGRKKAVDLIPSPLKLFTVGRLDMDSEGLILVTNDGDFAQSIIHPSQGIEKEYRVYIKPSLKSIDAYRIMRGVPLSDGEFAAQSFRVEASGQEILLVIHEGRNRIIRRVFDKLGYIVTRLVRTRIGKLEMGTLKPGMWRELTGDEIQKSFS